MLPVPEGGQGRGGDGAEKSKYFGCGNIGRVAGAGSALRPLEGESCPSPSI